MKCELVIKKGQEVKNGTVTITTSMETIAKAFQDKGWDILYFEPIGIKEDKDTLHLELGGV